MDSSGAIPKGFPKAARGHLIRLPIAKGFDNLCTIKQFTGASKNTFIATCNFQKFF
jgi:hypothetical protein